jgi:glycosyltransferase involved in cell wall biosynthesis
MSRILITIPTWNEAAVIERNLETLSAAVSRLFPLDECLIEVADNGSTDETRAIVKKMEERNRIIRLFELNERGKGIAIRRSWERHVADEDVLVFMDADLAADLEALPRLITPIIQGNADLVCGSRFLPGSRLRRAWHRELASRAYRLLQRTTLHLPVRDAQCGFKAMSARAAQDVLPFCRENGWMFDTELIALSAKKGLRIAEIPVDWIEHRTPGRRSALNLFRHGWGFVTGILRIRQRLNTSKIAS